MSRRGVRNDHFCHSGDNGLEEDAGGQKRDSTETFYGCCNSLAERWAGRPGRVDTERHDPSRDVLEAELTQCRMRSRGGNAGVAGGSAE